MKWYIRGLMILIAVVTWGCNKGLFQGSGNRVREAVCMLLPVGDSQVSGQVVFRKTRGEMRVTADVDGLPPGKYGLHIHEYGDCTNGSGGDFNPEKMPHHAPTETIRHLGDLGNLVVDRSGQGHLEFDISKLSFRGETSILGRSVVIHAKEDDFKTQPHGNAGEVIACGVIGIRGIIKQKK